MALISIANLNASLDALVKAYLRIAGVTGQTYGLGEPTLAYGAAVAATDLTTVIAALADIDAEADLVTQVRAFRDSVTGIGYAAEKSTGVVAAFDRHARNYPPDATVKDIQTLLTWWNVGTGTRWQALQHPAFYDLYSRIKGAAPSPWNLFFEVLQGATYANGLRKLIVGTGQTAGAAIDSAKYAGGFPYLMVSGLTGTGVVTVTGTAYDPAAKAAVAGKTWTGTVLANGALALAPGGGTPAPTDSLILDCSSIVAAGGISAGTIYVEAHRPATRPLLP